MIFVLFGPPGVGKTYMGQLIGRTLNIPFFDADTLIDAEEHQLIQSGLYDQNARDRFVKKLIKQVESILNDAGNQDLIIAEAFTKEKNRYEFMSNFPGNVFYIIVDTPRELAKERSDNRYSLGGHVINERAFETIWGEFEPPRFLHFTMPNADLSDDKIVENFTHLIQLAKRRRGNL